MTLFAVEIERRQRATLYVESPSGDEACEAAGELATDSDFFGSFDDEDISTTVVTSSNGNRVWSGGPDGSWGDPR